MWKTLVLAATRFGIEKRYIGSIKSALLDIDLIAFLSLILYFAYFSYGDIKDHWAILTWHLPKSDQ